MGHPFDGIFYRMCKIIHRINAPFISCVVVGHMSHTVNNRIAHIDIRGRHINFSTEYFTSILKFTVLHPFKQVQIFFHTAVTVRAVLSRLCQSTSVLTNFFCCQITNKCFAFFNQLNCCFIHLIKIIGCKKQTVLPVSTQPFHIGFNGFYKFNFFFRRVRIIKTQVKSAIKFLGKSIIQQNRLSMSDVQIAVRFRRKTGTNRLILTFCKIFINNLFNKISGNYLFFHGLPPHKYKSLLVAS